MRVPRLPLRQPGFSVAAVTDAIVSSDIRGVFREAYASARRDGILFVVLTVVLTPVAMALAALVSLLGFFYVFRPVSGEIETGRGFLTAFNVFLFLFLVCFLYRFWTKPTGRPAAARSVWAAVGVWVMMVGCSHGTALADSHPVWFWSLYGVMVVVYFGLLGRAYQPGGDYYLGWLDGWIDDPFTLRDDLDRGHVMLGVVSFIPSVVLEAYGEITGGGWIIGGLNESEQQLAADLLHALSTRNPSTIEHVRRRLDPVSAAHVIKVLDRMGLVQFGRSRLELTLDGEKLIESMDVN